jgi:hypothetical protein
LRTDVVPGELREQRAVEHARDRTILLQLTVDARRFVFDAELVNAPCKHLDQRALMPAERRALVSLKNTRSHCAMIAAHFRLLPPTTTNSPGIR